jgi:GT2 family glycosyltransferase
MLDRSDISVIVCAYTEKRWDDLGAAIESLRLQTIVPGQIVVIIDHNPQLFERAKAAFPDILVIENTEKQGLSGARNSGLRHVTGSIVAFMDEDAMAAPDLIARLAAHFDREDVMGVGGAIVPLWAGGRPKWFPTEFDWVVGCTYRGMPQKTAPVRNLIGCNMAFRREVFDTIGGFRDGIGRVGTRPVGCEETELCIRARQHWPERTFLYEPEAKVSHRVPRERANWAYFRSRCYSEGLSKALVASLVGANDGLSSERAYTLRILPTGVLQGLGDGFRLDFSGFGRAYAIISGLMLTGIGYLIGTFSERHTPREEALDRQLA